MASERSHNVRECLSVPKDNDPDFDVLFLIDVALREALMLFPVKAVHLDTVEPATANAIYYQGRTLALSKAAERRETAWTDWLGIAIGEQDLLNDKIRDQPMSSSNVSPIVFGRLQVDRFRHPPKKPTEKDAKEGKGPDVMCQPPTHVFDPTIRSSIESPALVAWSKFAHYMNTRSQPQSTSSSEQHDTRETKKARLDDGAPGLLVFVA